MHLRSFFLLGCIVLATNGCAGHDADTSVRPAVSSDPATGSTDGSAPDVSAMTVLRDVARARMRAAAEYFYRAVARHGGYAWHHRLADLSERWGDRRLDQDQVMIQPPGTADVAIALVEAAEADPTHAAYVTFATDAAMAVRRGQIQSGGWRLYADFKKSPTIPGCYHHAPADCGCAGCTASTYDDQTTQRALVAIMRTDALVAGSEPAIAESSAYARARMVTSQFPTLGGFPQVFTGPVAARAAPPASYPPSTGTSCGLPTCYENAYPTRYWDDPTLNDDVASAIVDMLATAAAIYAGEAATYRKMLDAYGAFLVLAQMPKPQRAWAQQYDGEMRPRWARSWEAPAIAGKESQDVMWALLRLYQMSPSVTSYRSAVGDALAYLEPLDYDGDTKIKRYIALESGNRPSNIGFYTVNPGGYPARFSLDPPTYQNYDWEPRSELPAIRAEYERLATDTTPRKRSCAQLRADAQHAIETMVDGDKWVTSYPTGPRKGATPGDWLDTGTFVTNLKTLAEVVKRADGECGPS